MNEKSISIRLQVKMLQWQREQKDNFQNTMIADKARSKIFLFLIFVDLLIRFLQRLDPQIFHRKWLRYYLIKYIFSVCTCGVSGTTPRISFLFRLCLLESMPPSSCKRFFTLEYNLRWDCTSSAPGVFSCLFSWFWLFCMVNLSISFHYILLSTKGLDIHK